MYLVNRGGEQKDDESEGGMDQSVYTAPLEFGRPMSTSSCASNSLTACSCHSSATKESGVRPFLFFEFTSTSSRASENFTTAACPFSAARDSGVWPVVSCKFTSCRYALAAISPLACALSRLNRVMSGHLRS